MNPAKILVFLFCLFPLLHGKLVAQDQFEGIITYQVKITFQADQKSNVPEFTEYRIRGNDMIVRISGSDNQEMARILIKGKEGAFYLIDDTLKTAMKVHAPKNDEGNIGNVPEQFREEYEKALEEAGTDDKPDQFNLEATGETMQIAGYECEKYIVKADNERAFAAEVWLTDRINIAVPEALQDKNNPLLAFMNGKGFPLKLIGRANAGQQEQTVEMTVIKIERTTLNPEEFSLPDDYQVSDLTGLLEGH